ncbi:hypothetical protein [Streptomyces umbrinus]|uniref:hypothetical protein n=1 Tax=Streptomyces umbrinus TaxID=67370 RepID=UPI0027D7CC75|nr:hypothetical protein [Streptomyces umbrinus]
MDHPSEIFEVGQEINTQQIGHRRQGRLQPGNRVHPAMRGIARLHNLNLAGQRDSSQRDQPRRHTQDPFTGQALAAVSPGLGTGNALSCWFSSGWWR